MARKKPTETEKGVRRKRKMSIDFKLHPEYSALSRTNFTSFGKFRLISSSTFYCGKSLEVGLNILK